MNGVGGKRQKRCGHMRRKSKCKREDREYREGLFAWEYRYRSNNAGAGAKKNFVAGGRSPLP